MLCSAGRGVAWKQEAHYASGGRTPSSQASQPTMLHLAGRRCATALSTTATRTALFSTRSGARPSAARSKVTPAVVLAPSLTTLAAVLYSTSSTLHAESPPSSRSSSLFRQADGTALRRPASQLLFMSYREEHRDEWQSWIGYFRQAGYDCIDMNLALEANDAELDSLSDELGGQVRLMSLQRPPLLFAYAGRGAQVAVHHVQSRRPNVSGVVLVLPNAADKDGDETLKQAEALDMKKLRMLVLKNKEDKDAIRTVERWMDAEGLS